MKSFNVHVPVGTIIIMLIVTLVVIWGWTSSSIILHPPKFALQVTPSDINIPYKEVAFKSTDGISHKGWFIEPVKPKGTIILCHGFGTNKSDILNYACFLYEGNYNVFLFDFRAHGDTKGKSSLGYFEMNDLEGAIEYLVRKGKVDESKIGAMGVSMGAAVVFMTASKNKYLKAVAGDSSFDSFEKTITRFARLFYHLPKYPFIPITIKACELRLMFHAKYADPLDYVGAISPKPILIIHGEKDQRIPVREAKLLYKMANPPKEILIVPGADHLQASIIMGKEYETRILQYFDKYLASE